MKDPFEDDEFKNYGCLSKTETAVLVVIIIILVGVATYKHFIGF